MLDWFSELTVWHWLSFGVILLILEIFGATGFLIGLAIGSIVMSVLTALDLVTSWQYQVFWFALLSIVFTVGYWKLFNRVNNFSEEPLMNDRAAQLIGRKQRLEQDLDNGQMRIQIGDTLWKVESDEKLEAGTLIEVYATQGMVLKIRSIEEHD